MANQQQYINAFIESLIARNRYSDYTIDAYARDIQKFEDWRDANNQPIMTPKIARRYVAYLSSHGLNGASIRRTLSSLRNWYQYLIKQKTAESNPFVGVSAPKVQKKLPKSLDPERISRLLDNNSKDPLMIRDIAMFELMYSSGLRLAELASIKLNQLDFSNGEARVIGKGNKERVVPIGSQAIEAITRWLNVRQNFEKDPVDTIFLSNRGTELSERAIQKRLQNLAIKSGLDMHVHPHMLRHSFASHILQSSGDLRATQEMLGHADISTTQIYTHLDFQHLAKVYDAAHPRAKKKE